MKHPATQPAGIYVHWPFCESKCPYCDFNSHVVRSFDAHDWADAYLRELARYHDEFPNLSIGSVFFGGGTPSLMPPMVVEAVLKQISTLWPQTEDLEITLEANPSSVEADRFVGFRAAGVNRISVGVQALNDDALRLLGRRHSADEARRAVELALATFGRVSADLIYARQHQSLADWESELREALGIGTSHLSLYQLTIEDGTPFGARHARGSLPGLPDEDLAADMFELTQDLCASAGMPAYEVSNHARSGEASRHNLVYWRSGSYLGVGPGAHGRIWSDSGRIATLAHKMPTQWLAAAMTGDGAEAERRLIAQEACGDEFVMMGLRLADGFSAAEYHRVAGRPLDAYKINRLVQDGMIHASNDQIRATARGTLILNHLIAELLD